VSENWFTFIPLALKTGRQNILNVKEH